MGIPGAIKKQIQKLFYRKQIFKLIKKFQNFSHFKD